MRTNDEALLKIKYNVLHEVAKLAFDGELAEKKDEIPFHLIPGAQSTVPLLRLQGKRDHPSESPPGRRKVPQPYT